ncbi:MAG: pyridoxal 5-phosphate synthase pdxS subunit, partial [Mycobacterium sp.]
MESAGQERSDRGISGAAGSNGSANSQTGTARVKRGMAEMLKGGVIMDVVTP